MITNFRKITVDLIKNYLGADFKVYDASASFENTGGDYATYYLLNFEQVSWNNNIDLIENIGGDLVATHKPLTIVTLQLDIRGNNSFDNSILLYNTISTQNCKDWLKSNGVYFMNLGQVTVLPILKNTKNEEGYIFDFTFCINNEFDEVILKANNILLERV